MVTVKRKNKAKTSAKAKAQKKKIKRPAVVKRTAKTKLKKASKVVTPQIVGKVMHYFPHVKAGVILVTKGSVALGDTLQIKGHTTDFKQKVSSMQINNVSIKQAKRGEEIGLLVKSRVRHNDLVYKIK